MKSGAKKVLVVSFMDGRQPYGSFLRPYYLNENLANMKFKIIAPCIQPPTIYDKTITYLPLAPSRKAPKTYYYLQFTKKLSRIIRAFQPDIIYTHRLIAPFSTLAAKIPSLSQAPVVADLHGLDSFEQWAYGKSLSYFIWSWAEKTILRHADHLVVAADFMKDYLHHRYRIPKDFISVVYNGVALERFIPVSMEERNQRKNQEGFGTRPVIVFTAPRSMPSNVLALKFLFKAIPYIEKAIENPLFLILGGGERISTKSSNVLYTGFVKNLDYYLSLGDIAIAPFPRRAVCGGARNKVLEYWACKLPVVSTKEGIRGIPDTTPNKEYLHASSTPRKFAEAVITLLQDVSLANQISQAGYNFVRGHLTWENAAKQVASILINLSR